MIAGLGGVPHLDFTVELIVIAAADLYAIEVAGLDEVSDDARCRSFSDSNVLSDLAHSHVRVAGDAQQYLCVI